MERPILILGIDRDNDLYEKAKVVGPIIGRAKNLTAATKLGLIDPEDSDFNAIFAAIKMYDQMKGEGKNVEIVTLTGDKKLGYEADKKISGQLEKIINELKPSSAILVTDGAADEEVLPIIKSRIKIDSTKIVIIKQSKELEKTYFLLLEKLKDPYYAKIIIGIPAILILLFSLASYFGIGWEIVGVIIGLYLIIRMMGIDEKISATMGDFKFSIEKISWIGYLSGFVLFLISIVTGYQSLKEGMVMGLGGEKLLAYVMRGVLWPLLAAFFFVILGKVMDAKAEKKTYKITRYALYMIGAILVTMLLKVGSNWILNLNPPYVGFGDFLLAIIVAMLLGYIGMTTIAWIRTDLVKRMKIEGKEVIAADGSLIGKIAGVDAKEEKIIVQTILEKRFNLPFSSIITIDDKVVVKVES